MSLAINGLGRSELQLEKYYVEIKLLSFFLVKGSRIGRSFFISQIFGSFFGCSGIIYCRTDLVI